MTVSAAMEPTISITEILDTPEQAFRRRAAMHNEYKRLMLSTFILAEEPKPMPLLTRIRDAISGRFLSPKDDVDPNTSITETSHPSQYLLRNTIDALTTEADRYEAESNNRRATYLRNLCSRLAVYAQ